MCKAYYIRESNFRPQSPTFSVDSVDGCSGGGEAILPQMPGFSMSNRGAMRGRGPGEAVGSSYADKVL
jgi:hypothetical protein